MHHLSDSNSEERVVRTARFFWYISGFFVSSIMFFIAYSWLFTDSKIIDSLNFLYKEIIFFICIYIILNTDSFLYNMLYLISNIFFSFILYILIRNFARNIYSKKEFFRNLLYKCGLTGQYFGGEWGIKLYIDGDTTSPHDGKLTIIQKLSGISVKLETRHSISVSTSASCIMQSDSAILTYTYNCYQTQEKSDANERKQLQHEGICINTFIKGNDGRLMLINGRFVNNFGVVSSGEFYAVHPVMFKLKP